MLSRLRDAVAAYLILSAFELVQYRLGFRAYVQLRRVVHQEYCVGPVDEPLAHVVEREHAVHVLAHLQYSGDLYDVHLRTERRTHAAPTFKTGTPGPRHPHPGSPVLLVARASIRAYGLYTRSGGDRRVSPVIR